MFAALASPISASQGPNFVPRRRSCVNTRASRTSPRLHVYRHELLPRCGRDGGRREPRETSQPDPSVHNTKNWKHECLREEEREGEQDEGGETGAAGLLDEDTNPRLKDEAQHINERPT